MRWWWIGMGLAVMVMMAGCSLLQSPPAGAAEQVTVDEYWLVIIDVNRPVAERQRAWQRRRKEMGPCDAAP